MQTVPIGWIKNINLEPSPFGGKAYLDFDPFTGERGLFGEAAMFRESGTFTGNILTNSVSSRAASCWLRSLTTTRLFFRTRV